MHSQQIENHILMIIETVVTAVVADTEQVIVTQKWCMTGIRLLQMASRKLAIFCA